MNAVDRRTAMKLGAGAIASLSMGEGVQAAGRPRPNILFIMADDLGYADLSCYGRDDYATPALDRLAREGMRFTSAYSNSPVCSATRCALITGRYQYRLPVGLEEPLARRPVGLPPSHPTLPSLLREAGYATALVGKWHLGMLPTFGPLQSGYEHFYGFRGGGVDYFTHGFGANSDLWDGDVRIDQHGYLTDLLADRAIDLLGRFAAGKKPFFLSLHFSAPHWPWEGPEDAAVAAELAQIRDPLAAMQHFDGGTMQTYAAMVTRMDTQVARLMAALRRLKLDRDTIIIFTSDNGGERFSKTWPFSGRKSELLEGGVRVPAILRWPGVARPRSTSDVPLMSMDWLPTLLGAAGVPQAAAYPSDGIDLAPVIRGAAAPARPMFWRFKYAAQRSARLGAWKYLAIGGNEFLFNLDADPMERANLAAREPQRFQALKASWTDWNATMLPIDPDSDSHGWDGKTMADRYTIP